MEKLDRREQIRESFALGHGAGEEDLQWAMRSRRERIHLHVRRSKLRNDARFVQTRVIRQRIEDELAWAQHDIGKFQLFRFTFEFLARVARADERWLPLRPASRFFIEQSPARFPIRDWQIVERDRKS